MTCTSHEINEYDVRELLESGSPYQIRLAIDEDTVARYEEIYREKGCDALPPIAITTNAAGKAIIVDGHHRVLAAQRAGLKTIKGAHQYCDGGVGSTANYILEAVRANAVHGLSLTRSDRMNAARLLLEGFPHKSLREIAAEVGLSKSTIANIKNEQKSLSNLDSQDSQDSLGNREIVCATCGAKGSEDDLTNPEAHWIKVCSKHFCCQMCRETFESRTNENALDHAATEILEAYEDEEDEAEDTGDTWNAGTRNADDTGDAWDPEDPEDPEERHPATSGNPSERVELKAEGHKKCPFCGSVPETVPHGTLTLFSIQCSNRNCLVHPFTCMQKTEEEAWEVWDTRAGEE